MVGDVGVVDWSVCDVGGTTIYGSATVDLMMVVLVLEPGITGGRTFAAFRAVSNIRIGCGGVFFINASGCLAGGSPVDVAVEEVSLLLLLLEQRRATQRFF